MKRKFQYVGSVFCLAVLSLMVSACAIKEAAKKVVGNSTQTLKEQSQSNALSQSFFCSYQACFDAVMSMARDNESSIPWKKTDQPNEGFFHIFMNDLYANPPHIIVMGIQGNIDTTEVGIFFVRTSRETIRVDISSLSSIAKRKVADAVFSQLSQKFKTVE